MTYRLLSIELFVRETEPARFAFALGAKGQGTAPAAREISPLVHVRWVLRDNAGRETYGCAADRMSVRWLDKRPGREKGQKLRELTALLEQAKEIYLKEPEFETPFARWLAAHQAIAAAGRQAGQEELTATFVSALMERAMLDGVSRLAGRPLQQLAVRNQLGMRPEQVHPELAGIRWDQVLPIEPRASIHVRHTVGPFDPLQAEDIPAGERRNDGLPETLAEVIDVYGVRHFKIKITGDEKTDLARLERLWQVLPQEREPVITLDANEAFQELAPLGRFVDRLEEEQLGLFQHIAYIEQPLARGVSLAKDSAGWIGRIGERKPLIIDESDSSLTAFQQAIALGYAGTSHKNCKGVLKSLLSSALVWHHAERDRILLLSAEDLQNLPVVPLQQDLTAVAMLGMGHCERNGHHYNRGLSMLSPRDKEQALKHHPDLYTARDGEGYLRIAGGAVQCASLQCPGFGVRAEPDWASMTPLAKWIKLRHPA